MTSAFRYYRKKKDERVNDNRKKKTIIKQEAHVTVMCFSSYLYK